MVDKREPKLTFSQVLQKEGILDEATSEALHKFQKQRQKFTTLGELAIEAGLMTSQDRKKILEEYKGKILLGELFIELKLVKPEELKVALKKSKAEKKRLGQVFLEMKLIGESDLVRTLSHQLNIPRIEPNIDLLKCEDLLNQVNYKYLRRQHVLPAFKNGSTLTVIMADPLDVEAIASLQKVFGCRIDPAIATKTKIDHALNQFYAKEGMKMDDAPSPVLKEDNFNLATTLVIGDSTIDWDGNRIINMVNHFITTAVAQGVSDIHIEPHENKIQVRYRIDGILYHKTDLPNSLGNPLATRIKVLCGLDIAERRKHQDGKIEAKILGEDVDLRVSTYASVYGENIVIRILKRQSKFIDLNQVGFTSRQLDTYQKILSEPAGVILVTGPTGSGKTTTLYASLNYINDQSKKIITVEDPVEYSIDGVIQGKFNPKIGLTYPEFIKSMMRQDPDVLMIGEIRDRESAEATVNASLTGHKVFSTFHTEDSVSALLRLMDMGIEPYLISSTVRAILAQRLVRVNCSFCSKRYDPSEGILDSFNLRNFNPKKWKFVRGEGCPDCNGTGYQGRTGIHEFLVVNDSIRRALLNQCSSTELRKIAREDSRLVSMREYGFYKAVRGITTPEEVLRVVYAAETDTHAVHTIEDIIDLCEIPSKQAPTPTDLR